jgi:signal transduction histidine kinase
MGAQKVSSRKVRASAAGEDLSRLQQQQQELQDNAGFLAEASAALAESLDYNRTLRRVAELAVPRIADWCTVTAVGEDLQFKRIAVVHRDATKQDLVNRYAAAFPPSDHRAGSLVETMRGGSAILMPIVTDAEIVAASQSPEHLEIMRGLGCASCILVPMIVRGEALGVISLMRMPGRRSYDAQDVALAEELAYRAGLAVDNSRLYREARRREATMRFLADASALLSSTLDRQPIFGQLARLVVPSFADWCAIDIVEGEALRQVAVAHLDPAKVALAEEIQRRYPPDPRASSGAPNVIRTGLSELYEDITDELLARGARDAEHLALLSTLGIRSVLIVPLVAHGKALGTLTMVWSESERRFTPEDIATMEDLGRRAGLAIENAQLYLQAQDAVQLREDFLSMASHELKTPLTGLQLQVSGIRRLLAKETPPDLEKLRPRMATVDRQLGRLSALIDSLLDVSHVSSGKMQLELGDVELASVLRDVADRFRDELAAKGCTLTLDLPEGVVGRWDQLRLDEVVTNLVHNAIKYGAGKPVSLSAWAKNGEATVEVRDQGIGLSAAEQGQLFKRFSRLVSPQHYGGFGLGLWIAKVFVEGMGGRVEVESTPGCGASFRAILPLAGPHA